MPQLHKKAFERAPEPTQLNEEDKVYYLESTNEVFDNYDDFFDRQIQLTSTIWICEFTGKMGLTYFEALESERAALATLGNFPTSLEIPILFIVKNYTCRGRFDDLLNDVVAVIKDRYFIGEECSFAEGGKRKTVKIISCSVQSFDNFVPPGDGILPRPTSFRYGVKIIDGAVGDNDEHRELTHFALSRGKQTASRQKLKLFLKNACFLNGDRHDVKGRFLQAGTINDLTWDQVLGGPEPTFPQTPLLSRGRTSKVNDQDTTIDASESEVSMVATPVDGERPKRKSEKGKAMSEKKRQRILSQQEELASIFENAKKLNVDLSSYEQTEKFLTANDISALKEAIKVARVEERDAQKELKRQKIRAKNEWGRKRDDLECDDLKPIPVYSDLPKPKWLSDEEFSDYLTILQFFTAFSDLLPTKEIRGTSRVTLPDIIMAMRCPDPQRSPYADLMRVLLSARTDRADEEDGDEGSRVSADLRNKDEITLIQLQNCDPAHPTFGDDIRDASALHKSIRMTHGESLRHLPVDWMTLSEILRLIFTTAGYYTGQNTHRHRLFARGYYRGYEDPAFVLVKENPDLLEKLKTGTVFDLSPRERFLIMDTVIRQLLSYSKFRTSQEEKLNQLMEQKKELRKLKTWDEQQEKEAKDSRLAQEYEIEKLEEQGLSTKPSPPVASEETKQLRQLLRSYRNASRNYQSDVLEELLLAGVAFNELVIEDVILARDIQREKAKEVEMSLIDNIFDMATSFGTLHLGRDRAFRNYFLVEALPGLLVENASERDFIGECVEATPNSSDSASLDDLLGCSGDMATCVVHGETAKSRRHWQYITDTETLEQLLAACNPRGMREIDLSEEIQYHRKRIDEILTKVKTKNENGQFMGTFMHEQEDPANMPQTVEWNVEMRELLLELEEKIEQGQLGRLPSPIDRTKWRELLFETGDVSSLVTEDVMVSGTEEDIIWTVEELKSLTETQKLALAFIQLAKCINLKFLKPPFILVKLDDSGKPCVSQVFQNWQRSISQCDSIPALALFLSTFEPCILWDKSRLQGKCRMCRRKGTAESLILCADCDKCFHLECVHLKEVRPEWICSDCIAIKKKLAAAEKRKAAKEMKEELIKEENGEYDDDADENSVIESSMDSTQSGEIVRTSSGRAVKRISTYRDSPVPATPPLKASRRQSTRTNGIVSAHSEEDEYDSDASVRKSKRKRTGPKDETPRSSAGLRDNDPDHKEKMTKLEQAVRDAMKLDFAWPFLEPVNEKEVPDYYNIIKNPIDLRTMINKMKKMDYDSPEEVKEDMQLLVANCKHYNEDGSEIYECAEQIEQFFDDRLKEVFDSKRRRR